AVIVTDRRQPNPGHGRPATVALPTRLPTLWTRLPLAKQGQMLLDPAEQFAAVAPQLVDEVRPHPGRLHPRQHFEGVQEPVAKGLTEELGPGRPGGLPEDLGNPPPQLGRRRLAGQPDAADEPSAPGLGDVHLGLRVVAADEPLLRLLAAPEE